MDVFLGFYDVVGTSVVEVICPVVTKTTTSLGEGAVALNSHAVSLGQANILIKSRNVALFHCIFT